MDHVDDTTGWYSEEAATFGDRLAGAREACDFSQKKLARHLGVKLKTVVSWEQDISEPRANKLQMVSGLLNVSMRWLLTGEGVGLGEPETEELPGDVARLLSELRDLRVDAARMSERIGRLEKRLRAALKENL